MTVGKGEGAAKEDRDAGDGHQSALSQAVEAIDRIRNCSSQETADEAALAFCFANSKSARRRLVHPPTPPHPLRPPSKPIEISFYQQDGKEVDEDEASSTVPHLVLLKIQEGYQTQHQAICQGPCLRLSKGICLASL